VISTDRQLVQKRFPLAAAEDDGRRESTVIFTRDSPGAVGLTVALEIEFVPRRLSECRVGAVSLLPDEQPERHEQAHDNGREDVEGALPVRLRAASSPALAAAALATASEATRFQPPPYRIAHSALCCASQRSRSRVVTFDRPYKGNGAAGFLSNEYPLVALVERMGLDVTYWTDVDFHQRPQLLMHHRALISLQHDEYWSSAMRSGALHARANGVNIAFFGANADYRHIRFASTRLGKARANCGRHNA
jgi:hypothetical protein